MCLLACVYDPLVIDQSLNRKALSESYALRLVPKEPVFDNEQKDVFGLKIHSYRAKIWPKTWFWHFILYRNGRKTHRKHLIVLGIFMRFSCVWYQKKGNFISNNLTLIALQYSHCKGQNGIYLGISYRVS